MQAVRADEHSEHRRLQLAQRLYELAAESGTGEIHFHEHRLDRARAKPRETAYKLSDPRAALADMVRFCNIWLPLPLLACIARGAPPFIPLPPPFLVGCFLIGCQINVCRFPFRMRAIYLCI